MTTKTVKIKSLSVVDTGDPDGFDEVIPICQADSGAPVRFPFKPGDSIPAQSTGSYMFAGTDAPPLFIIFKDALTITICDQDQDQDQGMARGTNDFGGCFWIDGNSVTPTNPITVSNGKNGPDYALGRKRAAYAIDWQWADEDPFDPFITSDDDRLTVQL